MYVVWGEGTDHMVFGLVTKTATLDAYESKRSLFEKYFTKCFLKKQHCQLYES
jgi:hypothetical protein